MQGTTLWGCAGRILLFCISCTDRRVHILRAAVSPATKMLMKASAHSGLEAMLK
jgi:hypothetical protein